MKILITGANGFIGKNLAEGLKKHELFTPNSSDLNLLEQAKVKDYVKSNGIDCIVHAAGEVPTRRFPETRWTLERNLRMYFNIVQVSSSVDKIICLGSGAEYGRNRDLYGISEGEFGKVAPSDAYGFSKYVCSKHALESVNIYALRLFGVFGKYEDYRCRFIGNSILRAFTGKDIIIHQNAIFDYLYAPDLTKIVDKIIKEQHLCKVYNATPLKSISLLQIANLINDISLSDAKIIVKNSGLNFEYTGDNSLLLRDYPGIRFTEYKKSIRDMCGYYSELLNDGLVDHFGLEENKAFANCIARRY